MQETLVQSLGQEDPLEKESEKVKVKPLSHVQLLGTPWAAAHQAPLSMEFSSQEY